VTPNKISYSYHGGVKPSFSTIAELRDALLASYPAAAYYGAPVVGIHRDDTAPAWGWVQRLVQTRTDWWPAVGIALQHAAQDGGDLARIALADLLECYQETVVLLEWTEPIARQWPDVVAGKSGAAFGQPDYRLATIVVGQRTLWDSQRSTEIGIEGIGPGGKYLHADVNTAADLEALLATSAKAGKPSGGEGPWSWLLHELLFHHEMQPWVPAACAKFAAGSDAEVRAMLDWFAEDHDLWRCLDLLEGWSVSPPPWWNESVDTKPRGWRHPIREGHVTGTKILGEVAIGALSSARGQAGTHPIVDLAPIFGGRPA
jgi:hypothetical protein